MTLGTSEAKRPAPYTRGNNRQRGMKCPLSRGVIHELKNALSVGTPITYAASHAGCSYEAIKTWLREAETGVSVRGRKLKPEEVELRQDLKQAVEDGKAAFVLRHMTNITKKSQDDWKASAWSLSHAPETREQFSEAGRVRIEVEKRLAVAITVLQRELPPDMFERVLVSMNEATLEAG